MSIPSSGAVSASQINTELARSSNATISLNSTDPRDLANLETTNSTIAFSSFRDKSRTMEFVFTPGTGQTITHTDYTEGGINYRQTAFSAGTSDITTGFYQITKLGMNNSYNTINYIYVGGGGAGGQILISGATTRRGGGGGGSQVRSGSFVANTFSTGINLEVRVGRGGLKAALNSTSFGGTGSNSRFTPAPTGGSPGVVSDALGGGPGGNGILASRSAPTVAGPGGGGGYLLASGTHYFGTGGTSNLMGSSFNGKNAALSTKTDGTSVRMAGGGAASSTAEDPNTLGGANVWYGRLESGPNFGGAIFRAVAGGGQGGQQRILFSSGPPPTYVWEGGKQPFTSPGSGGYGGYFFSSTNYLEPSSGVDGIAILRYRI
jgi:hypothetical protein